MIDVFIQAYHCHLDRRRTGFGQETGTGKTYHTQLMAEIALLLGKRVVLVSPDQDSAKQMLFRDYFPFRRRWLDHPPTFEEWAREYGQQWEKP